MPNCLFARIRNQDLGWRERYPATFQKIIWARPVQELLERLGRENEREKAPESYSPGPVTRSADNERFPGAPPGLVQLVKSVIFYFLPRACALCEKRDVHVYE